MHESWQPVLICCYYTFNLPGTAGKCSKWTLCKPLYVKLEGGWTARSPLAVSHGVQFPCCFFFFLQCWKQLAVSKCFLCPFPTLYAVFSLYRSILEYFAFQTRGSHGIQVSCPPIITLQYASLKYYCKRLAPAYKCYQHLIHSSDEQV